jgi:predicted Zn-ribbon and HTH transcriptional regulator
MLGIILKIESPSENSYNRSYLDKIKLMEKVDDKRIVFIGGSNLAFGLNSPVIEKEIIECKVINLGLNAGIGLRYMLADYEKYLQKGDTVIIVPEYENFYNDGSGSQVLWEVLSLKKSLKNLTVFNFIRSLPYLFTATKDILMADENKEYGQKFSYDRRGFNENGDYTGHWKYKGKEKIQVRILSNSKITISIINYLEKFIERSEKKGIKVILLPPVFQKSSYEINKEKIEKISNSLITKFEVEPKVFSYEDNLFFDTVYHLNKQGVDLRTKEIIRILKKKGH